MADEKTVECFLCGCTSELKQKKYPGYKEPQTFEIYYCKSCNTSFSFPRVNTDKVYEDIYRNGELVPGYDRYWEFARTIKNHSKPLEYLASVEETYWGVRESLLHFISQKKTSSVLEIGSGLGYLTYSLIKDNYQAIGLDISPTAVKLATANFGNNYVCTDLYEYAQNHSEKFDIVILTEVIEHINNPLDFIKTIMKLVKPGGRVIITTPNKSLYPLDLLWETELPPVHCWWFSEDSMKYISKRIESELTLINFKEFYKQCYHEVDLKLFYSKPTPKPILNNAGELIEKIVKNEKAKTLTFRAILARIDILKLVVRKIRKLLNPDLIVCSDRGIVLCAIFQKR